MLCLTILTGLMLGFQEIFIRGDTGRCGEIWGDPHRADARLPGQVWPSLPIPPHISPSLQDKYGHAHVGYYVLLCSMLGAVAQKRKS